MGWFGRERKPRFLSIDLETRSEANLGKCGVYRYVEGDYWKILLFCYYFEDDEDVSMVDMASGEGLPPEVLSALEDPDIIKYAWNASFERTNLSRYLGKRLDPRQWRCTMVWAAEMSLPLSLKNAADVLKVPQQKDRAGDALIKKFSVPQKPTKSNGMKTWLEPSDLPEQWEAFKSYCKQDVRTEDSIRRRLERFPLPMSEWEMYWIDQDINDRGIKIDVDFVRAAMECDRQMSEKMEAEARELTGLENPNSVQQMQGWLRAHGVYLSSLGKDLVQDKIAEMEKDPQADPEALRMLRLRIQMAKSSIKKYEAAMRCVCKDGRARGLFQFYGASRTGRYSGRLIQLQNLKRNSVSYLKYARNLIKAGAYDTLSLLCDDVPDILSQCVRTMLVPKEGHEFIVAAFSAIEARCIAWEAGEEGTLRDFRNGKDLYCATASRMFGVPVEKHGQNADLRQKGKIAILACGYGGSAGAMAAMGALKMGLKEDELPDIVQAYREANPNIVRFWWDLDNSAAKCIKDHQDHTVGEGNTDSPGLIGFEFDRNVLWMKLPSGRRLAYVAPKLGKNRFGGRSIEFKGVGINNKWQTIETYGAKLSENCTQAIARDILCNSIKNLEAEGIHVVAHVHDECICEVPIGKYTVDDICSIMARNPEWCLNLPLTAAGYPAPDYYFKD